MTKGTFELRLCAGHCNRMTRCSNVKLADAPNTVTRAKDGKCKACLYGNTRDLSNEPITRGRTAEGLVLCTGTCGRMTRNSRMPPEKFPGVVVRTKGGMCSTCRRAVDPEHVEQRREKERKKRADKRPVATSASLELWLKARNKRLARRSAA